MSSQVLSEFCVCGAPYFHEWVCQDYFGSELYSLDSQTTASQESTSQLEEITCNAEGSERKSRFERIEELDDLFDFSKGSTKNSEDKEERKRKRENKEGNRAEIIEELEDLLDFSDVLQKRERRKAARRRRRAINTDISGDIASFAYTGPTLIEVKAETAGQRSITTQTILLGISCTPV